MLRFEGDRDFILTPDDLIARLSDASLIIQCIPGVEAVSAAEPRRAVCKVRPGFAFVRGTLDITITITEVVPGSSIRYRIHGKGIGSTNTAEAQLQASPRDGGSRAHWLVEITELGGLLKAVPQGLIRGAAQMVIDDIWTNVAKHLAGS